MLSHAGHSRSTYTRARVAQGNAACPRINTVHNRTLSPIKTVPPWPIKATQCLSRRLNALSDADAGAALAPGHGSRAGRRSSRWRGGLSQQDGLPALGAPAARVQVALIPWDLGAQLPSQHGPPCIPAAQQSRSRSELPGQQARLLQSAGIQVSFRDVCSLCVS